MSKVVRVIVLRTAGTNCDQETGFAFEYFGAQVEYIHINELFRGEKRLDDFQILAIPGGFSYGDDIISGRILANELRLRLGQDLQRFINDGKLMIGICNGFQVLVRAGILPGAPDAEQIWTPQTGQSVTLTYNDSAKFEARWTHLTTQGQCVWTRGMDRVIFAPVAHAEGKFLVGDPSLLAAMKARQQIVFCYCDETGGKPSYPDNPNGSVEDIAGITDRTGRILGMMPHPERHMLRRQHPYWTRVKQTGELGDGARIFENGVAYARAHLL